MGKTIHSFVGGELSFLKLGSVLVGLSGGVVNFSSTGKITVFEEIPISRNGPDRAYFFLDALST